MMAHPFGLILSGSVVGGDMVAARMINCHQQRTTSQCMHTDERRVRRAVARNDGVDGGLKLPRQERHGAGRGQVANGHLNE